jgi:hypothetical protein
MTLAFVHLAPSLAAQQAQGVQSQDRPSPLGSAEMRLNSQKIDLTYGRPSMRGRKIFGGLIPYGQVWRTGANEATSFITEANIIIGGARVPAGAYTLYTLPQESGWKLIINKQTGQWGTTYHPSQDLARVDMQVEHLTAPVEQFTMTFSQRSQDAGVLRMEWERTGVWVDVALQ